MSLAARIRERLATWEGTDADLARELGCARSRIASERAKAKRRPAERICECRRVFRPRHGAKRCEDCRGSREAKELHRCSSCGLSGHNRRTCGRAEPATIQGAPKVALAVRDVGL